MTSRGQCPRGGGCACECLHPPPPFRKSCIRACVPPIQVQTPPPPTWMAGYGPVDLYRYLAILADDIGKVVEYLDQVGRPKSDLQESQAKLS